MYLVLPERPRWEGCTRSPVTQSCPWRSVWGYFDKCEVEAMIQFSSNWTSKWPLLFAQNGCKARHEEPWSKTQTKLFHFTNISSGGWFLQGLSKTWKAAHSPFFHLPCFLALLILLLWDKRQQNICFPCQRCVFVCFLTGRVAGSLRLENTILTFYLCSGNRISSYKVK